MRNFSLLSQLAAIAAFAGVLGVAGPAVAQAVTTPDAPNDMGSSADLRSARVAYTQDRVRVGLVHDDLVDDGLTGAKIYFDTNPDRRGPEYVMVAGLYQGTDYELFHARSNWQPKGSPVSGCDYILRLRFATERTLVSVSPECFGDPTEVRVGVFVSSDTESGTKVDWLSGERAFTDWVTRG